LMPAAVQTSCWWAATCNFADSVSTLLLDMGTSCHKVACAWLRAVVAPSGQLHPTRLKRVS
jgi:hypothetical protein